MVEQVVSVRAETVKRLQGDLAVHLRAVTKPLGVSIEVSEKSVRIEGTYLSDVRRVSADILALDAEVGRGSA